MKSNLNHVGAGLVLLLLFCSIPCVYAQDFSDLISFFNNQFIPAEEISVEDGRVVVKYRMEMTLGPKEFGEDILYIFGKITKEFPDSDTIRIECLVGEEILFEYEMSIKDILDYVNGKIGDEEIMSKIRVKDFVSSEVGLTFESNSKKSGSSAQIPLTLNGIEDKIGNMDITLGYDPSVLEATEVIKGGLTANSVFDYNIIGKGTIKMSLSMAGKQGFSGDGSIAYIVFDVIGSEGSDSQLDIVSVSANRAEDMAPMNIPTQDGVFTVISAEQKAGLSPEQYEIVETFGWPHSFSILEIDDAEGQPCRYESWTYYDGETTYIFVDGVFQRWEQFEPFPGGAIVTPYRPNQLVMGASPEEVRALAVGGEWVPVPSTEWLLEGIVEGIEVYVAPQLVAGFHERRLVFVDAVALVHEGGES